MTIQCVFESLNRPAIDLQKKKIIFSDEAHFDLGYIPAKTSKIAQKTRTHTLKYLRTQNESLFGANFGSRGLIGSLFFENEQGEAVTVNGDRYRAMLNEFLFTKFEEEDIDNIWFQQDGAMSIKRSYTQCSAPCF